MVASCLHGKRTTAFRSSGFFEEIPLDWKKLRSGQLDVVAVQGSTNENRTPRALASAVLWSPSALVQRWVAAQNFHNLNACILLNAGGTIWHVFCARSLQVIDSELVEPGGLEGSIEGA
jgi:hypothetical protein